MKKEFCKISVFYNPKPLTTFLIFMLLLFSGGICRAQDSYSLKKIDLPAPFKYTEIRAIRQDNDGYTWFTTSQGIWRYDGTDVQPFDIDDPDMSQRAVPDIIYCYDGYILLFFDISHGCKILAYDTHASKILKYKIDEHPRNFFLNKKGVLQFVSAKFQLWQFSRKELLKKGENITHIKGWTFNLKMDNYLVDDDGSAYVFYQQRVARIKDGRLSFGPAAITNLYNEYKLHTYAKNVLCSPKYLLARYSSGFIVYDKHTLTKIYEYDGIDVQAAYLTNNHFVVVQNGNNKIHPADSLFTVQQVPPAINMGAIKEYVPEPGSGRILIAAEKGMFELVPKAAAVDRDNAAKKAIVDFFKGKSIRSIYRLKNGKLYAGTYNGFYSLDKGGVHVIFHTVVYCMSRLNNNTLLLGTEGGSGFATVNTETDVVELMNNKSNFIYGFSLLKDGNSYLAGGAYNLYRLQTQPDEQWQAQLILHSDTLGAVKQIIAVKNNWWVATSLGLFSLDKNNQIKKIFPLHENYGVYAMQKDGNNFWLGTAAHGLIKIDKNCKILSQLKFSDGLAGDFVYSLFKINGLLYAGTNQGLSVFNTNAGMQSINPPDDPQYSEELNHSAIFYDEAQQQLIFGGVNGLLFPDMEYYASAKGKETDVIKLAYVKKGANGVEAPKTDLFAYLQKSIVLDPGYLFMGLKFSGNLASRQHNFLFRINEIDTLWHKSSLNNEISFYGLAPGTYTLQARFPSVIDKRYWFTKTIIVVPHFYQSWLFKLIMALLTALAIYAAWLYRVSKIRNEHLLRTTIASDLHDEIGSALTRISLSSELMNIKKQMDANVVERISTDSKRAIASISDIIWSVDARNDNKDDLILRMKEHAYNMLDEIATVNFEVQGLDKVVNLPQLTRQNIYLIFKEAINNIAKHNVNPQVWIILNNQMSSMTITIKNTIDTRQKPAFAGQGLKNMRMRVQRMKAALDIVNEDGIFSITIKMKRW